MGVGCVCVCLCPLPISYRGRVSEGLYYRQQTDTTVMLAYSILPCMDFYESPWGTHSEVSSWLDLEDETVKADCSHS